MQAFRKRTWAEIDLDAARHNYQTLKARLPEGVAMCCVIKANAYGHGATRLARLYAELGADFLAVATIEEAMCLRREGITLPLLILGYTPAECAPLLARERISQTVFSLSYAKALSESAHRAGVTVRIHIKLDTGMGRLGFLCREEQTCADALAEAAEACRLPALLPEGIFTHFAVADEGADGVAYTEGQKRAFLFAIQALEADGITFPLRHCANSAGILEFPDKVFNMARAGIALYGSLPSSVLRTPAELAPVMSLRSVISLIKPLHAGESVSYGRTFTATHDMRVATIPVGYADGYRRANGQNGACVLIRGKRAPILGRVCMDQCVVDVTQIPDAREGDTVTLMGSDGDERIPAEELAERNHTISYEIFCNVGERVPRIYRQNGRTVATLDHLVPWDPTEEE